MPCAWCPLFRIILCNAHTSHTHHTVIKQSINVNNVAFQRHWRGVLVKSAKIRRCVNWARSTHYLYDWDTIRSMDSGDVKVICQNEMKTQIVDCLHHVYGTSWLVVEILLYLQRGICRRLLDAHRTPSTQSTEQNPYVTFKYKNVQIKLFIAFWIWHTHNDCLSEQNHIHSIAGILAKLPSNKIDNSRVCCLLIADRCASWRLVIFYRSWF